MTDAILAALHRLQLSVDGLREDVNALATMQLGRGERELLAVLFRAAHPVFRDSAFTTRDVFAWPALQPIVRELTPAALSWLFGRAESVTIAGVRVRRIGTERDGAVWQLVRQVATSAPAGAPDCGAMEPDQSTRG